MLSGTRSCVFCYADKVAACSSVLSAAIKAGMSPLPGGSRQVTLCDPMLSSRSGDSRPACKLLYAHFTFTQGSFKDLTGYTMSEFSNSLYTALV